VEDIHVIDLLNHIRTRSKMYFGGSPTNAMLAEEVATDARQASSAVGVLHVEPFVLVHADADWMSIARLNSDWPSVKAVGNTVELFSRLLPRGTTPAHGCRAEPFIAAVSAGWITFGDGEELSRDFNEADLPDLLRPHLRAHARALAWRFDAAHWERLQADLRANE